MEFIGRYPDVPIDLVEGKVVCFYGEVGMISLALTLCFEETVEVKEGFNLYRKSGVIVITFSINGLSENSKVFGLLKLVKITDAVVCALDDKVWDEYSSNVDSVYRKHLFTKLNFNTFEKVQFEKKDLGYNVKQFSANGIAKYLDSYSELTCDKVDETIQKKYQQGYHVLLSKINFHDEVFDYFKANIAIKEFVVYSIRLGINLTEDIVKNIIDINYKELLVNRELLIEPLYEIVTKYILENFKLKEKISHMFVLKKYISESFDEMLKSLKKPNRLESQEKFQKTVWKYIAKFIEGSSERIDRPLESFLQGIHRKFIKDIDELVKATEYKIRASLKIYQPPKSGWDFQLITSVLNYEELTWDNLITKPAHFISKIFIEKAIYHKESSILLVEEENSHKKIILLWPKNEKPQIVFPPIQDSDEDKEMQTNCMTLAEGSCRDCIVCVLNYNTIIIIKQGSKEPNVYSKENIDKILFPCYINHHENLLFINENNELWRYTLNKNHAQKVNFREKVLNLKLSKDQETFAVKTESEIKIFNLRLNLLHTYSTTITSFELISQDTLIIYNFDNSEFITFSNTAKSNKIQAHSVCPIQGVDFLFRIPVKKPKDFILHVTNSEKSEKIMKYYDQLSKLFTNVKLSSLTSMPISILRKNFKYHFFSGICVKIADFLNNNIVPYKKEHDFYTLLQNPLKDFYQEVFDQINFDIIESLIETMTDVKVISLIGNFNTLKQLCRILNSPLHLKPGTGIWASISRRKKQNYLILYSNDRGSPLEKAKTLKFFHLISNILILDSKCDLEFYSSIFKYSKNRISGFPISTPRIEIFALSDDKEISDKLFNFKFYSSNFTSSGLKLSIQLKYLISEYSKIQPQLVKNLMLRMKHALALLFLDDDTDLNSRISGETPEVTIMKHFITKHYGLIIRSFQLNKNNSSSRCRATCPACTSMCVLNKGHEEPHSARVHKLIKNKCMFDKFSLIKGRSCDLVCGIKFPHTHTEPCVGYCYAEGTGRKHNSTGCQFDASSSTYPYDTTPCNIWWKSRKWEI